MLEERQACTNHYSFKLTSGAYRYLSFASGVLPAEHVCQQYFKDNNFLFFGGLVVAASLEAV
eukprot:6199923-Pleurochrysis_carterae.AAC.2